MSDLGRRVIALWAMSITIIVAQISVRPPYCSAMKTGDLYPIMV